MSYMAECDYTDWLLTGSPLPKMDRGWGESHTTGRKCSWGGCAPPKVTTKGKINWFVIVLHANANSFVVMSAFKFCHLRVMWGLLTWERKENILNQVNASWHHWVYIVEMQTKKQPPTETSTKAFIVPVRFLNLYVGSFHLHLITWIIKQTKSFLTHMNRILKPYYLW